MLRVWASFFLALTLCALAQVSSGVSQFTKPNYYMVTWGSLSQNLDVFYSADGISWWAKTPEVNYALHALTRDPSVMKYNGVCYLAHTDAITSPPLTYFDFTSSSDCVTYSAPPAHISVTSIAGVANTWAPEWFIDPTGSGLSSIHVIVSASNSGTSAFQLYELHPTASDFSTWSNPVLLTVTGESNIIDPAMVWRADLSKYCVWFLGGSAPSNFLRYACSSTLTGTYGPVVSDPGGFGTWSEGPSLMQIVPGSPGTWRIWFDSDCCGGGVGQIMYSDSTDGWATWTAKQYTSTPGQARHGTVIPYP